jgi:pimeloyl-ACP methyl ester carboxylesterase
MGQHVISYKTSQINYYFWGIGHRLVLCFHGYGENAGNFSFLEKYSGNELCVIAIDLPFHGATAWNEGLNFTISDLSIIIQLIIDQVSQSHAKSKHTPQLTLLGFSLGGRVALSYYEANPEKVERLVLLAPDGLKVNFWYWLSTQTWAGNKLFAFTMRYPGWFFLLLKLFNKLKLVNSSIYKFVSFYIGDPLVRKQLYQRWTGLRKMKPDIDHIKSLIRKNNTLTNILYGLHDRIILPRRGEKFKEGLPSCHIKVIEAGHQVLHEKHVSEIMNALCY